MGAAGSRVGGQLLVDTEGRRALQASGWRYHIAPGSLSVSCIDAPVARWLDDDWVRAQFVEKARPRAYHRNGWPSIREGDAAAVRLFQALAWHDWRVYGPGLIVMAETIAQLGPYPPGCPREY